MFGNALLAQGRLGDSQVLTMRPRSKALGLTYTISISKYATPLTLTYTIQQAATSAFLLYYLISPTPAFSINGDSSIVRPDHMVYTPQPVVARTLLGGPLLQGFATMSWSYSTLLLSEYDQLLAYYDPTDPQVLITYPDETGTWVQRQAVLHPPSYGTRQTVSVSNVTLIFTRLTPL